MLGMAANFHNRGAPPHPRTGAPPPRGGGLRAGAPTFTAVGGRLPPDWGRFEENPSGELAAPPPPRQAPGRRGDIGRDLDVHELLKREAFGDANPSCDNHFEKNKPCPESVYGISDQYLTLDSFSKLRSSDTANGVMQWNFMVQGVTGDEVLGVRDIIDTIIEAQIGAFSLPFIPEVPYILAAPPPVVPSGMNRLILVHNNANATAPFEPTLVPNVAPDGQYPKEALLAGTTTVTPWIHNPYTQVPFAGHLTIQIREAGLQSYSDRGGARHHFEFALSYPAGPDGRNPTMCYAVPQNGAKWDTFIFTDCLKDMHGITLVFRNPDVPIRFEPDCLYDIEFDSDGAAAPGPFLRAAAPAHGLAMGDRVFIEGFASGNPTLDNYVNRAAGQVVAGDPAAPPLPPGTPLAAAGFPDVFWLDPAIGIADLTPAPALPTTATVCVAKRRVRIPIRLRRVVPRLTQYIKPR